MEKRITMGHGSGGKLSHQLYQELVLPYFGNPALNELDDAALVKGGSELAISTDGYVVKPIFFPGGDIGKLAVCGTVNDLTVCGSRAMYLTCGMVIEEGFLIKDLEKIIASMASESGKAGVNIVAGDLKVVEHGAADGIFINTAGVGVVERRLSTKNIKSGDRILYLGELAAHGAAIVIARGKLKLRGNLKSDCRTLKKILLPLLGLPGLRFMRDPTRGGLAGVLCEIAASCGKALCVDEASLPINKRVAAVCELTGLDPLFLANEGAAVIIVSAKDAKRLIKKVKTSSGPAAITDIGAIEAEGPGRAYLRGTGGGSRVLEMLAGEQLPRIC
jgi:hydrogenase expression/formation protein HypE